MGRLRWLICVATLATAAVAGSASAASAATFYVNAATGSNANTCTEAARACKTIAAAVKDSEVAEGAANIEVAAGTYEEVVELKNPADDGITINGAGSGGGGTEIVGPKASTSATVKMILPDSTGTLSNLAVVVQSGDSEDGIESATEATLNNVTVDMRNAGKAYGVLGAEFGSVTMNGGGVSMEGVTKEGVAIAAEGTAMTVNGASITVANGSTAAGIESEFAPVTIDNTSVSLGSNAQVGILAGLGVVSLSNVSVVQASEESGGYAMEFELPSSLSVNGANVTMAGAKNSEPAILQAFGNGTLEGLNVSGAWSGTSLVSEGGNITLRDSRLLESPAHDSSAVDYLGISEGPGLFIQRSVLQAAPGAAPATLEVMNANATIDSSELLGGTNGVFFAHGAGKVRTLTIAGSTIDAGTLGVGEEPGVSGVTVDSGGTASIANVAIEGSIVLEHQVAEAGGGNEAHVTCSYSDVPSQTQAAKGSEGAIACAAGSEGNTHSTPESLFAAPITNYVLNPSSSAVDSVPVAAIKLPFGFTPSTTDLAGNPRFEDLDCVALQDKGALELQGHSTPCPAPTPPPSPTPSVAKPLAGIISALTISPSAFFAAPSGATISAIAAKAKKYGAKITYRDSQIATTTFTVLRETSGRKQGKSCKKPSKSNKHGKRCTILTAVGSFTHVDIAGANSLHFSGQLKGKKLSPGSYKLQAIAHDAAGNGAAVEKSFKIK